MEDVPHSPTPPPPKLLEQLRDKLRLKHYSIRTESSYIDWARRFILFHDKRHPRTLGAKAVEAFLTHLAVERNVSASTQNQAKSALLFLYKEALDIDLPWRRIGQGIAPLARRADTARGARAAERAFRHHGAAEIRGALSQAGNVR